MTRTGFEHTIYRTRDEHADYYPTIVFNEEVRIVIPRSQRTIQVRGLKFVNANRNSTNLKHNLLYKVEFLFIAESDIYDTTGDTG